MTATPVNSGKKPTSEYLYGVLAILAAFKLASFIPSEEVRGFYLLILLVGLAGWLGWRAISWLRKKVHARRTAA